MAPPQCSAGALQSSTLQHQRQHLSTGSHRCQRTSGQAYREAGAFPTPAHIKPRCVLRTGVSRALARIKCRRISCTGAFRTPANIVRRFISHPGSYCAPPHTGRWRMSNIATYQLLEHFERWRIMNTSIYLTTALSNACAY